MIELAKIRTDGGTQSRAAINEETVAEYAEAMRQPETVFPPVIVYYDGRAYWLADGFHRVEAWREIGRVEVPAEVRQGDRRQAILHSCRANSAHGLRRTNADKRRAVWTLLEDAEWGEWSDRQISKQCGVSHTFVANLRREISGEGMAESGNGCHQEAKSKPDQETPPNPADGAATPDAVAEGTSSGGALTPAAAPEPAPDPYGYAKLTEEALLETANGLRADLDDEKAKRKKAEAEARTVKAKLADLTADDKDEVIRRLQAEVKNAGNAKWKAIEDRDAYHRQVNKLKKRVAELEQMGVAY